MNIPINSLIRYLKANSSSEDRLFRVIHSDTSNLVLFPIYKCKAPYPFISPREKLESDLKNQISRFEDHDPFTERQAILEENIPEKVKAMRDSAYESIISIVEKNGVFNPDTLDYHKRATMVAEAAIKFSVDIKTIRLRIRRFWQCGMTKDAMLPYFERWGSPGEPHIQRDKKIGRPTTKEKKEGSGAAPLYNGEELRMIMFEGLMKYYKSRTELTEVLDKILLESFSLPGEKRVNKDGIEEPVLVAKELRLTYTQLRFFYTREFMKDPIGFLKNRKGERRFNQESKATLENSTAYAFAPGSIYQIDSTKLDINLVLTWDRYLVIGTPTVYAISDVFSRAVAGFCLTMENASWCAGLLAMDNAFSGKVPFCAEYGITIDESQWPMKDLPEGYLADNAEMKTKYSKALDERLKVKISNTAPYTPEWKGIIEKRIDLTNKLVRNQPGGVSSPWKRGEPSTREFACLTPYEATQVLILGFLFYNNHHVLDRRYYHRTEDMIIDKVPLIPNILWAWGIENRGGQLRHESRNKIMLNLLPRAQGSITPSGFLSDGKIYHAQDREMEERLSVLAKAKGKNVKFTAIRDPRRPELIYGLLDARKAPLPLFLNGDDKAYYGKHELEWIAQNEIDLIREEDQKGDETQARVSTSLTVDSIVSHAKKETEAAQEKHPKTKGGRTKDMKINKKAERDFERKNRPLLPDPRSLSSDTDTEIESCKVRLENGGKYIPSPSQADLISKLEEETDDESK